MKTYVAITYLFPYSPHTDLYYYILEYSLGFYTVKIYFDVSFA
jgi:hypothetical protein